MLRFFLSLTFFGLFSACQSYEILQKPILYDQTRVDLSLEYLAQQHQLVREQPVINPVMIVIHWTTLGDLESAYRVFYEPVKPQFRNDDPFLPQELNVSSHYLVDRDGSIYQLMPDSLLANHVVGLNYCSIGIKNVGNHDQPLTEMQLEANSFLVKSLAKKYHIEYLIGNYEYPLFSSHSLWKNYNGQPVEHKQDPGEEFMNKLRDELRKLDLKGAPNY